MDGWKILTFFQPLKASTKLQDGVETASSSSVDVSSFLDQPLKFSLSSFPSQSASLTETPRRLLCHHPQENSHGFH